MNEETQESIKLLNTAIIKSKEKNINDSYEERLSLICSSPAISALTKAIKILAEETSVSRDQAAVEIVNALRDLDAVWHDYMVMEGITKLKEILEP